MSRHNIRNYSIFLCDDVLFSYFEYSGTDLDRDMAEMAAHPESREWARLTDACQTPFAPGAPPSGLWTQAVEVFHLDERQMRGHCAPNQTPSARPAPGPHSMRVMPSARGAATIVQSDNEEK